MIKKYEFNNLNKLKDCKFKIILPQIKNGTWIQDIYEKIIKEIKLEIFIKDNLDKQIIVNNINNITNINIIDLNKIIYDNRLDYLYTMIEYKILVYINIDTNLEKMCIWNLEYPPDIDGLLYIK